MTQEPFTCVVDASVGIKLLVEEEDSDRANRLFEHLKTPATRLYVPDLFYIECANILWKYVRRFGYTERDARQNLKKLNAMALSRVQTTGLLDDAFKIAVARSVSVYDACYVALSMATQAPLVTADKKLARKYTDVPKQVYALDDFEMPPFS